MGNPDAIFRLPQLDQLHPSSSVTIRVPAVEESIQIGTIKPVNLRNLIVAKKLASVTLEREDKLCLRIDDVYGGPPGEVRRPLIIRPLARFVLTPCSEPEHWQLIEGGEAAVNSPSNLTGFFELVASFALRKQTQLGAQAEHEQALLRIADSAIPDQP